MNQRIELLSFIPERDRDLYIEGELSVFRETFPGVTPSREVMQAANDIVAGLLSNDLQDACTVLVDGEPAGFIILSLQWLYNIPQVMVDSLYVSSPYRGMGLGKHMLDFAEDWTRAQGAQTLRIEVANANHPAHELYRNSGFADVRAHMEKWVGR